MLCLPFCLFITVVVASRRGKFVPSSKHFQDHTALSKGKENLGTINEAKGVSEVRFRLHRCVGRL